MKSMRLRLGDTEFVQSQAGLPTVSPGPTRKIFISDESLHTNGTLGSQKPVSG